jgi:hypothetical protein
MYFSSTSEWTDAFLFHASRLGGGWAVEIENFLYILWEHIIPESGKTDSLRGLSMPESGDKDDLCGIWAPGSGDEESRRVMMFIPESGANESLRNILALLQNSRLWQFYDDYMHQLWMGNESIHFYTRFIQSLIATIKIVLITKRPQPSNIMDRTFAP